MDSATQFVLGACVGAAVLGPRIGPRKAAILGGLLGTVPDLDVFYPFDGPVDAFVLHRGPTHSLVVQALATPIFGEAILRIFRRFRESVREPVFLANRWRVYAAVYLIFATHALLDAMTVYGTKLLWPLSTEPFGLGSIFIIDPLYTIPLLILTLWAIGQARWGPRFRMGLVAAFVASTSYLGWTAAAQQIALARATNVIGEARADDVFLSTPTPFNSLFWKVVLLRGDDYVNVYVPLLGGSDQIQAYRHPRNVTALACAGDVIDVARVSDFSHDFIRLERDGDDIRIADLRMGLTPDYVFRFVVGRVGADGVMPIETMRLRPARDIERDLDWLLAGMAGEGRARSAEVDGESQLPLNDAPLLSSRVAC